MQQKTISDIRAFNRYYTGIIGLLDRHILNSPFSLPEARILYELHHREGIQASGIIESLGIDKGYLSRILDQFAKQKLIVRKRSASDGRSMHIYLTEKGRAAFHKLDQASDEQLKGLLEGLSPADGEILSRHMIAIRQILSDGTESQRQKSDKAALLPAIHIRTDLRPGDLGYVIYLHGALYKAECDYGIGFEAYVAQGLAEFHKQYDPSRDRVWICEHEGHIVGFLALMHRSDESAQLRYLLLLPEYRGIGLGKRLMEFYMAYLKEKGYRSSYLWTTRDQETAISLYKRYGFQLVEEKASSTFGKDVYEQKYELPLTP